ncbi:hypothetical protein HGH90_23345 [Chitinophaga sp. Ak27]|nr:hypothetical protein [Chitinophaga sp. Ak27]
MKTLVIISFSALVILNSCAGNDNTADSQTDSPAKATKIKTGIKLAAFKNVNALSSSLSDNGIGEVRPWRGDELGWIASTPYFQFGGNSEVNGMQNNLAYYLTSDSPEYVKTLKIVLNINNSAEKDQAIAKFKQLIAKTFKGLSLDPPTGLYRKIPTGETFTATNQNFNTSLKLDQSKIDTWILQIESN